MYLILKGNVVLYQIIFKFCERLDSKILQITCKELVENTLPGIINALVNGHPPSQVCETIGICKSITTYKSLKLLLLLNA